MKVNVAYPAKNMLGEGPLWSVESQALYWVDIEKPAIYQWRPSEVQAREWNLPEHVGSLALRPDGSALIALRTGLAFFDFESGTITPVANPEADIDGNRFNDGKCDRQGRFWAGTLSYKEREPVGALYRLDTDRQIKKMRSNVTVSNGLGWSPDNKTMYYADSPTQCIYSYDFDAESGEIANERVFVKDEHGYPDGLTVDSEGYVWSAKWDGWRVVRYAPDGRIDQTVEMPVQRPTSCMFGGPDLRHLYITTASTRLKEEELKKQPLAGHLLVVETQVKGLPEPLYRG